MRSILLMLVLFAATPALARAEVITFASYTPVSERPLLTETYSRDPVTISGFLAMPSEKGAYERAGKVTAPAVSCATENQPGHRA